MSLEGGNFSVLSSHNVAPLLILRKIPFVYKYSVKKRCFLNAVGFLRKS